MYHFIKHVYVEGILKQFKIFIRVLLKVICRYNCNHYNTSHCFSVLDTRNRTPSNGCIINVNLLIALRYGLKNYPFSPVFLVTHGNNQLPVVPPSPSWCRLVADVLLDQTEARYGETNFVMKLAQDPSALFDKGVFSLFTDGYCGVCFRGLISFFIW